MRKAIPRSVSAPEICLARQTVRLAEREIRLPDLSFRLLRLLSERAPEPVSFEDIGRLVWGGYVSRETIKQRVKILRDSLAALGVPNGGVESSRSVGYRLTQSLDTYEPPVGEDRRPSLGRLWVPAAGLAACFAAAAIYLFLPNQRVGAEPLSLSVQGASSVAQPRSANWDAAQQTLMSELSRMSDLAVVAADGGPPKTDLVVEMDRVPDGPYEVLVLALKETETGEVLWAETYGLDQAGYDKPISIFVASVHEQIAALGLRPTQAIRPEDSDRARQLYLSATSAARSEREADLLTARARLDSALSLRPTFALARSLRARVDARLVMAHGHDHRRALEALGEAQALVDAHPDVPEFRRTLAAVQIAQGNVPQALQNLEAAGRHMPFLQPEIVALRRQMTVQPSQ